MNEDQVAEAVEAVYTGKLAKDIKSKAGYSVTGMIIGGALGVMAASFLGKNRFVFGLIGAAVAGGSGYLIAKK